MQIDYSKHPSFSSSSSHWQLPINLLEQFNSVYLFCKNHGRTLSIPVKSKVSHECHEVLTQIFKTLKSQADADRNQFFLDELEQYTQALLSDDLHFFFRSINNKKSQITRNDNSLAWAYSLSISKYYTHSLSSDLVEKMLEISQSSITEFRQIARKGEVSREALSINTGPVIHKLVRLLNHEFERKGVNQSVSLYMGQEMWVGGLALELSLPEATWWRNTYPDLAHHPQTLYFHTDESRAYPKSIVYLTDVSDNSGPTGVVEQALEDILLNPLQLLVGRVIGKVGRSPDSPLLQQYQHIYHQAFGCSLFRKDFMLLPPNMRWNSHFGWDILPGSDIEHELIERESKVLGKAGTFLVFDGANLLHRGGMVKTGERIALQVIFTPKIPYFQRALNKIKLIIKSFIKYPSENKVSL